MFRLRPSPDGNDAKNDATLVLQKRYEAICTEWLGGLKVLQHKSKIIGEQLGTHLDQLLIRPVEVSMRHT